jgi:hypothetical protein
VFSLSQTIEAHLKKALHVGLALDSRISGPNVVCSGRAARLIRLRNDPPGPEFPEFLDNFLSKVFDVCGTELQIRSLASGLASTCPTPSSRLENDAAFQRPEGRTESALSFKNYRKGPRVAKQVPGSGRQKTGGNDEEDLKAEATPSFGCPGQFLSAFGRRASLSGFSCPARPTQECQTGKMIVSFIQSNFHSVQEDTSATTKAFAFGMFASKLSLSRRSRRAATKRYGKAEGLRGSGADK